MNERVARPGDVLMVSLPSPRPKGHEQEGVRPVIVVGVPPGALRFPVVVIVPLASQVGHWARRNAGIYPIVAAGTAGLSTVSVALLDQIRCVDVERVTEYIGSLSADEYRYVEDGLGLFLSPGKR